MDVLLIIKKVHTEERIMEFLSPSVPVIGATIKLNNDVLDEVNVYCVNRVRWDVVNTVEQTSIVSVSVYVSESGLIK